MSFFFGFGGEDIDEDDADLPNSYSQRTADRDIQPSVAPKKWTLQELLQLLPSQISYNTLRISTSRHDESYSINICRRSLFDIRTQLMAEASPGENDNDWLLAGLDDGDLTSGHYEGGFKTWECAIELAESVAKLQLQGKWHVVELGAGSAIPSLTLLQAALRGWSSAQDIRFTLCDYNEDVLKLCTMPNVVLSCIVGGSGEPMRGMTDAECDIDLEAVSSDLPKDLERQLEQKGISIDFVSGPWGVEFDHLVQGCSLDGNTENILILASETIYAPASIEAFTSAILNLLKAGNESSRALVAAKRIYFGVGGGVDEFVRCVRNAGGISEVVANVGSGVGRTILEVTMGPG